MSHTTARTRAFEWWLALCTAGLGLWLILSPASMDGPAFRELLDLATEQQWAVIFAVAGFGHLAALLVNGSGPWTPWVRCATTAFCVLLYLSFAQGFYKMDHTTTAVFTYGFCMAGGALWCFARSVRDVARSVYDARKH